MQVNRLNPSFNGIFKIEKDKNNLDNEDFARLAEDSLGLFRKCMSFTEQEIKIALPEQLDEKYKSFLAERRVKNYDHKPIHDVTTIERLNQLI